MRKSSACAVRRKSVIGSTRVPVGRCFKKLGHADKKGPAAATMVTDTIPNEELSVHFFVSRTEPASTLPSGWEVDRIFRKMMPDIATPEVSVAQARQST